MSYAAIAADFDKSLYVHGDFSSQIAFHVDILFDIITQLGDVLFCQVFYARVGIDSCFGKNFVRRGQTDAVYISQADLDAFFSW